jgi:TRAP-type uncharacterized transport system substrate-binding protein
MKHPLGKFFCNLMLVLALVNFVVPLDILARGRSGGFSSSRSSSSSWGSSKKSPWSNRSSGISWGKKKSSTTTKRTKVASTKKFGSKKATTAPAKKFGSKKATAKPAKGKAFGKVGTTKKAPVARKIPGSRTDKKIDKATAKKRSAAADTKYAQNQSRFKGSSKKVDFKSAKNQASLKSTYRRVGYSSPSTYSYRRNNFYSSWDMPSYGYGFAPSFGMWDTMSLMYAMNHLDDPMYAMMFYANRSNPMMLLYMSSLKDKKSSDPALATKVTELEAKIKKMELDGVKAEPEGYIPPKMGDLALTKEAVVAMDEAATFKINFGTASKSGNYFRFGNLLEKNSLLEEGKLDAALVQADAFKVYMKENPKSKLVAKDGQRTVQGTMYPEYAHLLVNRKSGIKSVKDLKPGKHVVLIPKGSGTEVSWKSYTMLDKRYAKIKTEDVGGDSALARVVMDKNAVMLFTCSLNSGTLVKAKQHATDLRLADVDDWDFNDFKDQWGNKVYTFQDIPKSQYGDLQKGWWSEKITTVAVDAVLVLSTDWLDKNGAEGKEAFDAAVLAAKPKMDKIISRR